MVAKLDFKEGSPLICFELHSLIFKDKFTIQERNWICITTIYEYYLQDVFFICVSSYLNLYKCFEDGEVKGQGVFLDITGPHFPSRSCNLKIKSRGQTRTHLSLLQDCSKRKETLPSDI